MEDLLEYFQPGVLFLVKLITSIYNLIVNNKLIAFFFFLPFAAYMFYLLIDFFKDVSMLHYDKKVSNYSFYSGRSLKFDKHKFKTLYDNKKLNFDSQKLQSELKQRVKNAEYLHKQSYIREIESQLHGVPDDLKHSVAEKIYNKHVSNMSKYYGRGVHISNHGVVNDDDFDDTDEI